MSYVNIDGEVLDVEIQTTYDYPMVTDDNSREWYVFQDSESAGEAAREYWEDMAKNNPKEFIFMVGEDALIQWMLGNFAGHGTTSVNSLTSWLDLWLNNPEKQWARCDGSEIEGTVSREAMSELGFDNKEVVFYRHS